MRWNFFRSHEHLVMAAVLSAAIHFALLSLTGHKRPTLNQRASIVLSVELQQATDRKSEEAPHEVVVDEEGDDVAPAEAKPAKASPVTALKAPPLVPPLLPLASAEPSEFRADLYKSPKEIDESAHVQHVDMPQPPEGGQERSGRLLLKVYVGENGQADFIEYENQELAEDYVLRVRDSFMKANFTPGYAGGKPVRSWMKIELRYDVLPKLEAR